MSKRGHHPFRFLTFTTLALSSSLAFYFIKRREKIIKEHEAQKTELQKLRAISYQYQLEVEQVISYFASSMSDQRTPDDILWDIARNCISKLGFEDCVIYLKDEDRNVLIQKAALGPKTTAFDKILNPIEIPLGQGIVGSVAASGKAEIIPDTTVDSRYIVDDAERQSEIAVPMIDNGKIIGVIDSEHPEKNFYTQRHLHILTSIASHCADKINKVKAEQEVHKRELELITLNRNLATSRLTALRAQMNPHFIFNALNSVQQYILTGNVDEANKYLSKFSKLQREVLHHCDNDFISLEKELDMIALYLELEQLRFNGTFESQIVVSENIDSTEIKIPPMLLQPFIENAIWHGLVPKTTNRRVNIHFELLGDEILQCVIRDNGIGRTAAAKLKSAQNGLAEHKSKGLSLVEERMKILQDHYQQPFEARISDIMDNKRDITGTQVALHLYIGHQIYQV